jgi:hypothetical protein
MQTYFQKSTSAAPLTVFRIVFGLLIFGSIVRFWSKGWVEDLYITPKYFFPFYGFEFVKPLGDFTYFIFVVCAVAALFVAAGYFYRIAAAALFFSFTYIELMDKSTYLNHYYFISMISLLLIFLPAHAYFSIDAFRNKKLLSDKVPCWSIDVLKVFVCMMYFLAGLAKINSDWLLEAQPLRIWLPAKNDVPLIGRLFNEAWVPYAFSWLGCLYDLSIPFLLLNRKTRMPAYAMVILFHILTAILFPIGMFPYIMIAVGLIFFSPAFHEKILQKIGGWLRASNEFLNPVKTYHYSQWTTRCFIAGLAVFFLIQVSLPFRYILYPGELFWTEEGYRFSWRVMLMEKAGYAQFTVHDDNGQHTMVDNKQFLTTLQEKMMSTQPDMILQYAHILRDYYRHQGYSNPKVFVDSYVGLNGRMGKPLIDPQTDLASQQESFNHKPWILPFHDDIKGF